MLVLLMEKTQYLDLICRVTSGMAYYEFGDVNNIKRKLYLNHDIVDFVICYLLDGRNARLSQLHKKENEKLDSLFT